MDLAAVIRDLETVQREVFGTQPGDEPDAFADYDRACELARMLRRAIETLKDH